MKTDISTFSIKKVLKLLLKFILLFFIIGILHLNYAMYYKPAFIKKENGYYNKDVYEQLSFLKDEMKNGAGLEMQDLFPEGFIFINSLYGLTWANLIQEVDQQSLLFKEGIHEINWTLEQVNSAQGKEIFNEFLPLEYGVFYRGWTNYLLGKKLSLQTENERDLIEVQTFIKNCKDIEFAIIQSKSPYLESYRDQSWPADNFVAMASIALHDKLSIPKYQAFISNWIEKVKQYLDPTTQLIPHAVYSDTGKTLETARGSSQSLTLNFLIDIDPTFAKSQFNIYKELFLDSRFGLPGIREYPKSDKGSGDVDSGPVILGIGGSASIVGQRTMGKFENWDSYEGLRNSIEGFGAAYSINEKKKYIFGALPMADAFIAWSNSIECNSSEVKTTSNWRWKFQLLSVFLVIAFGYFIFRK